MRRAWAMVQLGGLSLSEAMKAQWDLQKAVVLDQLLRESEAVTFEFKKVDGTLRKAVGTIKMEVLEAYNAVPKGEGRATGTRTFFDLEAQAWRSMRLGSLVRIINTSTSAQ